MIKARIENLLKDLSISKELGNKAREGLAYCNLGIEYQSVGDFKQAVDYHQKDLSISKELGDREAEASAYCNLGNAYQSLGDFKQAIGYHEKYLSISKELGDRAGEGEEVLMVILVLSTSVWVISN